MRQPLVMIAGTALGMVLVFGTGTPAFARNCRKDVRRAEERLDQAVHRHGVHSRQAEQRRRQLEDVRARCRF